MAVGDVVKHQKVVIRGIFDGTPEIWSYSLKFKSVYALNPDQKVEDIDQTEVLTALTAFHAASRFAAATWCTGWRAYDIGVDGKMVGNPVIVEFAPAAYLKGTGGSNLPLTTSMCVTSEAENRGPGRYGRFFLPLPSMTIGTDFRWTSAAIDSMLTAVVTMVKAISNASKPQDVVPLVNISAESAGSAHGYSAHGPVQQEVKRLKIGLVPDVIQTRSNKLLEEYRVGSDISW